MIRLSQNKNQSGFTLVEILVATSIFIVVVTAMLGLLDMTLRINRKVQNLREVVQGTRTFTETITKEIRNGRIFYDTDLSPECLSNYNSLINQSLAIETRSGDKLCFYLNSNGSFILRRLTALRDDREVLFDTSRVKINPSTFRLFVYPKTDPNPGGGPAPGIQPFVTIVAQFSLGAASDELTTTINYQTTISTDVYDTESN